MKSAFSTQDPFYYGGRRDSLHLDEQPTAKQIEQQHLLEGTIDTRHFVEMVHSDFRITSHYGLVGVDDPQEAADSLRAVAETIVIILRTMGEHVTLTYSFVI